MTTMKDLENQALLIRTNTSLREGQSLMIALQKTNGVVYEYIVGTEADCFYKDSNIPMFKKNVPRFLNLP